MSDESPHGRRGHFRVWWEVWLPLLLSALALAGLNLVLYWKFAPGGS
ncbi:MAG: hypothetical protein ACP5G7_07685 [Anaerolineae bacterium]